jgi:hypothetical protein
LPDVKQEFFRMAKGFFSKAVATGAFHVEDLDLAVRGLPEEDTLARLLAKGGWRPGRVTGSGRARDGTG